MAHERTETSSAHFQHAAFVFPQLAGFAGRLLQVDQLDGARQFDGDGVVFLGETGKCAPELHVGPEAADAHDHFHLPAFAQRTRQFEEVHRLLKGEGGNALIFPDGGETGLILIIHTADLHHGAEAADACHYVLAGLGVLAQNARSGGPVGGLHHGTDGGMERLVEAADHLAPVLLALGDHVELLFHLGGEVEVHDVGEVFNEKIVHHHADVGGEELLLLGTGILCGGLVADIAVRQGEDAVRTLDTVAIFLHHVAALLHGADGGCIRGRASDAELFELFHQTCLGVARSGPVEALGCGHFLHSELLALAHFRQQALLFGIILVILALEVHFEETVECDHFTLCPQHVRRTCADGDVHHGLLQLGIGHLAGQGAFPDEVVELLPIAITAGVAHPHFGGADGFVRLLRAFAFGGESARLAVACTVLFANGLLCGADGQLAEVDAVGTHIGDVPLLVQTLCDAHRAVHAIAQLAAGFLLQRGSGEGCGGGSLGGLFLHSLHGKFRADAAFQEFHRFGPGGEPLRQIGLYSGLASGEELRRDAEGALGVKADDLTLAVYDEAHGHALHTSCAEAGLHLAPEHRAQLIAHQTVQHTAGLLGVHQVDVDGAWGGHGLSDCFLGDLIEGDAFHLAIGQFQRLL